MTHPTAQDIITTLNLIPNEERGYYIQTFQDPRDIPNTNRSASTAIYYLLEGEVGWSYWHRIDAVEVWHHYAGSALTLALSWNNRTPSSYHTLGSDVLAGERPQLVIEAGRWQRARSEGDWSLVGTTVAPGFVVEGFEMPSPGGWEPDHGTMSVEDVESW